MRNNKKKHRHCEEPRRGDAAISGSEIASVAALSRNDGKKRIAIFVSGSGTNMENIIRRVQAGELDCEAGLVVCDNPQAGALKRAARLNVGTFVIERENFKSKSEFDDRISQELKRREINLVLLAGFMRILGPEFVRAWRWRILNIHPSLLPKHPGAHAIRDAFEAKETKTGVTIHFVDEGVDTGSIILQREVPIKTGDTLETLEERVHACEYELYPEALKLYLCGKLAIEGRKVKIS